MDDKGRIYDLCLTYLWLRGQLSNWEVDEYHRRLEQITGEKCFGLDAALTNLAERLCQLESLEFS